MGIGHPNEKSDITMADRCIGLSKEYNLFNKYVFFNDWVEYSERRNYLLEADIGISTYTNNLETRFSFRTRVLDYIWCELPVILTEGDYISKLAVDGGFGLSYLEKDVIMLSNKIIELLDNKELYNECKENIKKYKNGYKWEEVIKPIINFCNVPYISNDKKCKVNIFYKDSLFKKHKILFSKN